MKRSFTKHPVLASRAVANQNTVISQFSFDFIYDGSYNEHKIEMIVNQVIEDKLGYEVNGIDFHSVDYSTVPDYADSDVCQCSVDFNHPDDYKDRIITTEIEDKMNAAGYEVIGSDFYAM